jgi:hypothetical protein
MYEGKIKMPRYTRNCGFQYKYVVRRRNKDKVEWEYVFKRTTPSYMRDKNEKQAEVNRRFNFPEKDRAFTGLF